MPFLPYLRKKLHKNKLTSKEAVLKQPCITHRCVQFRSQRDGKQLLTLDSKIISKEQNLSNNNSKTLALCEERETEFHTFFFVYSALNY